MALDIETALPHFLTMLELGITDGDLFVKQQQQSG